MLLKKLTLGITGTACHSFFGRVHVAHLYSFSILYFWLVINITTNNLFLSLYFYFQIIQNDNMTYFKQMVINKTILYT